MNLIEARLDKDKRAFPLKELDFVLAQQYSSIEELIVAITLLEIAVSKAVYDPDPSDPNNIRLFLSKGFTPIGFLDVSSVT